MNKEAIFHKMDKEYAYALSKNTFLIKLRTKKNDLDSVKLYYCDKYLRKYKVKQEDINIIVSLKIERTRFCNSSKVFR